MEKTIDFLGEIEIEPRLTKDEIERVNAFPRRTPVAGHPAAKCGWVASAGGRKLTVRVGEEYGEEAAWLRLIVKSFPRRGIARFHGVLVGRRYASNELFCIQVRGNRVTERELWPPSTQPRESRRPTPPAAKVIDLASRRDQAGAR